MHVSALVSTHPEHMAHHRISSHLLPSGWHACRLAATHSSANWIPRTVAVSLPLLLPETQRHGAEPQNVPSAVRSPSAPWRDGGAVGLLPWEFLQHSQSCHCPIFFGSFDLGWPQPAAAGSGASVSPPERLSSGPGDEITNPSHWTSGQCPGPHPLALQKYSHKDGK